METAVLRSRRIVAAACVAVLALRSAAVMCIHEDGAARTESPILSSCCSGAEGCPSPAGAALSGDCPDDHSHGDPSCRGCSDYSLGTVSPQCSCDGGPSLDDLRPLAAAIVPEASAIAALEFRHGTAVRHSTGPPPPILERLRTVFLLL